MNYRKAFKLLIGIVLSVLLMYLAFTKVEISVVIESLKQTKLEYVLLGIGSFFLSLSVRSVLWKSLLASNHPVNLYPLFRSIVIGQMGNNLLPFRGGEVLRIYSINKTSNVSVPVALSSVAVERVLDLVSLVLFTGVLSLFIKIPDLLRASIAFIILCCFAVLSIMVYLANTSVLHKYVDWIMKFCPSKYRDSLEVVINNLIQGLSSLNSISLIFKIMTLSLICWGLVYFSVFFALQSYNLEVDWIMPLSVLVLLNIGMMVPTLPASLGVYQFFTVIALSYFSIDKNIALGLSFVIQAMDFIPSVLLGIIFLYRENTTNTIVQV